MRRALLNSFALVLLAAMPAQAAGTADSAQQQLRAAEQLRLAHQREAAAAAERARAAAATEARLAAARVAAAARLRVAEDATAKAADRMAALAARRRQARHDLAAQAAAFAPLLPVIERLGLYPTETLLAVPAPPDQALRGVLVLQGLARQLEQQARALRREQARVAALSARMKAEAPKLAAAQTAQARQEAALNRQIATAQADRQAAQNEAAAAERAAAADAAHASDLRGAIGRIETARRQAEARARAALAQAKREKHQQAAAAAKRQQLALAAPPGPGLPAARGQLTVPVAGTVVRSWGSPTVAGPATGMSFATPPGARVTTPCGGRVVFGAPFHSYGLLLIVDCGGGYDFVLAGMDRLDVSVGQTVRVGEPVGVMANWVPSRPGPHPSLYVELRHNGAPVNPAPWLRGKG